jgi:phosphatidylglycerophosphatase A
MKSRGEVVLFLATGFYIGNIPFAPGTFGTLIGLPICFMLGKIALAPAIFCALIFILLAVWIADKAEKILKKDDPGCIVIDEIAGMMVTLIGLPFNLATAVTGFIIFRALDIIKPVPIRNLDKRIPGGLGVVADDVVAGIIANFILRGLLYFISA